MIHVMYLYVQHVRQSFMIRGLGDGSMKAVYGTIQKMDSMFYGIFLLPYLPLNKSQHVDVEALL